MTKRRNQRRSGRRNLIPRSTLRVMPFLQYLGRQTAVIAAGGITNFSLPALTLASDLNSQRLVKFSTFVVKFYPTLQTAVQASVQLSVVDQATSQLVPITQIKPLSTVNQTSFSGSFPSFQGWVQAGSASIALVIIVYCSGIATFYYDVQTRMSLSQDLFS
jgi:hypothetical protein